MKKNIYWLLFWVIFMSCNVKVDASGKSILTLEHFRSSIITEQGDLYIWGSNKDGQIGNGTTENQLVPHKILSNVKKINSSGDYYGLFTGAITENRDLYMWGSNKDGQIGNGTTENQLVPQKVLPDIRDVRLGGEYSSAITENGDLYMWGANYEGQIGNGTREDQLIPQKILSNVKKVNVGWRNTGAITENGDLYIWGDNGYCQIGNGTREDQLVPQKILSDVKEVSLNNVFVGAIKENGDLYMWGSNNYGQVGSGTTNDQLVPQKILSDVKEISINSGTTGAITESGDLYMWGHNNCGQIGNGTTENQLVPKKILSNVKTIRMGDSYCSAITESGDLYMWGYNYFGQIGNGTEKIQLVPQKILSDVKEVSLNDICVGAITENDDLYMWGSNNYGQVGSGIEKKQLVPQKILSDVQEISLGFFHSGATIENGDLYMWGSNSHGQIGNGIVENVIAPVKVDVKNSDTTEITKNSIDIKTDTWEFSNFSGAEKKYWKLWFPELQAKELNECTKSAKGGLCYGMVMTAMALNSKEQSAADFSENTVEDIKKDSKSKSLGITAKDYIRYMFPIQTFSDIQNAYSNNLNDLYNAVKSFERGENVGVEIGVYGRYWFNDHAGHSLWGIRTEDDVTSSKIIVYDCNHPNEEKYIILNKDNTGKFVSWSYDVGLLGAGSFGTGEKGEPEIKYITLEATFYDVLKQKLNGKRISTNFEVDDRYLISLDNGTISSSDSIKEIELTGLLEMSEQEAESLKEKKLFWSEENIINIVNDGDGINASVIGDETGIKVVSEQGKSAKLSLDSSFSDTVEIDTLSGEQVEITFSQVETNGSITNKIIEGTTKDTIVKVEEKNEGNVITGISELTFTNSNILENEEGKEISNQEKKIQVDNLDDEKSYLVTVDENNVEKIKVLEDVDDDGEYETVILETEEVLSKLSGTIFIYNNKQQRPKPIVKDKQKNILIEGTDYELKYSSRNSSAVGRYSVTVIPKKNFIGKKTLYYTIVPKKTPSLTSIRYQYGNQIRLSWTKSTGASGYRIEYKKPGANKYTFLANTKNLYYTKGGLTAKKTYNFKVTPYVVINNTKYYSTDKAAYRTTYIATVTKGKKLVQVAKPTITKSGTKVKVKWKNIANETGYQISKSTSKTGTNIVSTYATKTGTSKQISATKGKTYYYKVRAYRTVEGKKIFGAWSTVVKYKR